MIQASRGLRSSSGRNLFLEGFEAEATYRRFVATEFAYWWHWLSRESWDLIKMMETCLFALLSYTFVITASFAPLMICCCPGIAVVKLHVQCMLLWWEIIVIQRIPCDGTVELNDKRSTTGGVFMWCHKTGTDRHQQGIHLISVI